MSNELPEIKPNRETSRAVIVLGMHRCGTSVLTRALNAVGVELGDDLLPGLADNPRGFFEDRAIVRLNEDILEARRAHWSSLVIPPLPEDVAEQFHARAVGLIREHFGTSLLWGFKDPRTTRLQGFWHRVMLDAGIRPVYILANRHPLSVVASLSKRNAIPESRGLALWALHQIDGLETILRDGGLVVDYEKMLQAPAAQLRRVAGFLARPFDATSPDITVFIDRFLEPDLQHFRCASDAPDLGHGSLGTLCREIHEHLRTLRDMAPDATSALSAQGERLAARVRNYFSELNDWVRMVDSL